MTVSASESEFEQLLEEAQLIKERTVGKATLWYKKNSRWPFRYFRGAGVLVIVLSVSLPTVVVLQFPGHNFVVSVMSVAIAALTGLSGFYKWERTWRSRMLCLQELRQLGAKFDLEIANARHLQEGRGRLMHVYHATNDMLTNYRVVCASESESFFSGLQFPQADRSSSDAKSDDFKKS